MNDTNNGKRGGLNVQEAPVSWGASSPTEVIDATSIDVLQLAAQICAGKPYNAGNLAYVICRREHYTAEQFGEMLAECFNAGELAHMLALTLAVLGASKGK